MNTSRAKLKPAVRNIRQMKSRAITTTATATDDTISGGEGADYVYGADGDDIIMSGFSIGDDGFWY